MSHCRFLNGIQLLQNNRCLEYRSFNSTPNFVKEACSVHDVLSVNMDIFNTKNYSKGIIVFICTALKYTMPKFC